MAIQVHFAKLNCIRTEDSGTDECVVRWNGNPIWMRSMEEGDIVDVASFQVLTADTGVVSLTETDGGPFDPDDHLGAHAIRKDELHQGWHRAFFKSDDADYFLDYEVFEG